MDRNDRLLEWLTSVFPDRMQDTGFLPLLLALLLSLASSLFISFLYVRFYESRATGSRIHRAFVLVGISITAIFIAIQFSLPLSLGLLGALSIVRFRTPIKEPEEIGFVLLVVAASLACATFSLLLLVSILGIAVVGLVVSRWSALRGRSEDGTLVVTLPAGEYDAHGETLIRRLESLLPRGRIDSVARNESESVISFSFLRLSTDALLAAQKELRGISDRATTNVFYHRSGEA